jgi:regulator of sigma E protease
MILSTIIIFVIILGLLVFVHELGHFYAAKKSGMRVEEFGFGFPPRLFGIKRGETIYSVNWIPIGGFVKIAGENGENPQDSGSFANKGFWPRFAVLIAGVTMNILFAWFVVMIAVSIGLPTEIRPDSDLPASARVNEPFVVFNNVSEGSPAQAAGFKIGDTVVSVNGQNVDTVEVIQAATQANLGQEIQFVVKRGDQIIEQTVVPRHDPPENQGPLGVSLSTVARVTYPWYEVPYRAAITTYDVLHGTIRAFVTIIGQWVSGESVEAQLSGPVGIAVLTRDVAQLGFIYLLQFTAVLSINLAVINAAPFPALDGGRIVFLIIEKLRGKKLPETAEGVANTIGFGLLILLMVFVTVKDFGRFDIIDRVVNIFT